MTETREEPDQHEDKEGAPFGSDQDKAGSGGGVEDNEMGVGGYGGRDPETDMPAIPNVPETQDDPRSHDGAPGGGQERNAGD